METDCPVIDWGLVGIGARTQTCPEWEVVDEKDEVWKRCQVMGCWSWASSMVEWELPLWVVQVGEPLEGAVAVGCVVEVSPVVVVLWVV